MRAQRQAAEAKARSEEARIKHIAMQEQKEQDAARMLAALVAKQEEMKQKDEARMQVLRWCWEGWRSSMV